MKEQKRKKTSRYIFPRLLLEKVFEKSLEIKIEANFAKKKLTEKNTSNSAYGQITKEDFGEEHCFKSVDRLKNEDNRKVTEFSKNRSTKLW